MTLSSPTVKDIVLYNTDVNTDKTYGRNILLLDDFRIETSIEKKLIISPSNDMFVESNVIIKFPCHTFLAPSFVNSGLPKLYN